MHELFEGELPTPDETEDANNNMPIKDLDETSKRPSQRTHLITR